MNPTRQLPRLIFTMVLLSIAAFCLSGPSHRLLLAAVGVVGLAWCLTEWPWRRPLPGWLTNFGALLVLGWIGAQVAMAQLELVHAAAQLAMGLQIAVLFRSKGNREFGQLLVLSAVMMAATSVISVSISFAIMLTAYFVLGMLTLLLLQLKTGHDQVVRANAQADAAAGGALQPIVGKGHRRHLRLTTLSIGGVCVMVSLIVFVAMPRRENGDDNSRRGGSAALRQIAFTERVNLTGAGIGGGSERVVMRISMTEDGEPYGSENQPMLVRGTSLDAYNRLEHIWRRSESARRHDRLTRFMIDAFGDQQRDNPPVDLANLPDDPPATRTAKFTLYGDNTDVLFTLYPGPVWFESDHVSNIQFNALDQRLAAHKTQSKITYQLRMPRRPLSNMQQHHHDALYGADSRFGRAHARALREFAPASYARYWNVETQRMRELANRILDRHGLSRDPEQQHTGRDQRLAQILADYLAANYNYTLSNPRLPRDVDPVISFLFDRQSGHCELFASAHAALCRAIGIPARVVTGYRATEYSELGDYYLVRERNAHAWTEVHGGPGVGWRHYDPSPAAPVESEHAAGSGLMQQVRAIYNYIEYTWAGTIVAFDPEHRAALIGAMRRFMIDPPRHALLWVGEALGLVRGASAIARVGRLTRLFIAVVMLALVLLLARLTYQAMVRRRRAKALQLQNLSRKEYRRLVRHVDFYFRMNKLLKKAGYRRPAWQTPRSFAHELAEANPLRFDPVLALTETFYEVRFGRRGLDESRKQQVEAHLKQLKHSLNGTTS